MSETTTIATILISSTALIIAILGYLINRKNLKVNEENLKIIMEKQNKKSDIETVLKVLEETSDALKRLPNYMYVDWFDLFLSDVIRVVHDNKQFSLQFEWKNFDNSSKVIDIESINNVDWYRNNVKNYLDSDHKIKFDSYYTLNFVAHPNINSTTWVDLEGMFTGLGKIEICIDKLKRYEGLLHLFGSELELVDKNCGEIFDYLYDALNKRVYKLDFNSDMKTSEIQDSVDALINLNQMREKAEYCSTEVAKRVDDLRKELFMQILTN